MSTISSIAPQRAIAGATAHAWWSAAAHWWVVYMTWRIERLAIARLREMSDPQLTDMGIAPAQIESAVSGESARGRVLGRCV
jgi:uncharacterized protein YjiS (DUF1127 family)